MIWSLVKVLVFVALVAMVSLLAGYLLEMRDGIRIAVAGWEFTLGPLQAVIAALIAAALLWLAMKAVGLVVAVFRFLNGDETAISRYFDRNRTERGYQALSDGMVALASGEGRLALVKAQRAAKYLGKPEITTLLIAQAAEAAGDGARATEAYKELLAEPATRFVGIQGLMKQKLAEGDTETALRLAEKAFAMKPRHGGTQDILLKLQAGAADWKGARATLGAKMRAGELPKDVFKRRDAVLALQEAKSVFAEEATVEAREAAIAANKASPDLIPGAVLASRGLLQKGDKKAAARVLRKAWEAQPHPDLAAAFAEIEPEESAAQRVLRFKGLWDARIDHDETRQLQAELLIAAEDFPAARRALGDMATRHPTQRNLAIMAAIERGEGSDEAVVRGWLARALSAPRGPQWCCDKCQSVHAEWQPVCDICEGFDTLSWREPVEKAHAPGADLLPLLVAAPKAAAPTAEPEPKPAPEPEVIDLAAIARRAN